MVRTRKRITRRDLRQPDQFISLTGKVSGFVEKHRVRLLIGLGLLVSILLVIWGWREYRDRQRIYAAAEYKRALAFFHSGNYDEALSIVEPLADYRHSTYGNLALLYKAHSYMGLEKPKDAILVLKKFLIREDKSPLMRQLGFLTLGYAHEKASQCADAVLFFMQAYDLNGPHQEEALLGNARCQEHAGNLKGAVKSYKLYLSKFPDALRRIEVLLHIQQIEAKVVQSLSTG